MEPKSKHTELHLSDLSISILHDVDGALSHSTAVAGKQRDCIASEIRVSRFSLEDVRTDCRNYILLLCLCCIVTADSFFFLSFYTTFVKESALASVVSWCHPVQ